jgi:hypothetical protein
MQKLTGFILFIGLYLSSSAFGQAYSISSNSTELAYYGGIRAMVDGDYSSAYDAPLNQLVSQAGCLPRGELLTSLGPAKLDSIMNRETVGVLRKGQNIVVTIKICADRVVGVQPLMSIRLETRDMTYYGSKAPFNKKVDASATLYGPDGNVIPFSWAGFTVSNYKTSYRHVDISNLAPGTYRFVVSSDAADVGLQRLNVSTSAEGY